MSEKTPVPFAYVRLAIAYFLQFAIWGSYGFALTGFVANYLGFKGGEVGWIGAAIPIGAIIAPLFVGPIADRYFSAQKVLAFLHFVAGALLIYASFQKSFLPMLIAMICVGACYMPTIALLNSIVFEHIPNRDNAPRVFMFGTIGWIAVVLFIQAFFGAGKTNGFFHVAASCCFILGVYALTLPNTPPKGATDGDVMGLKAFSLFKKPGFTAFIVMLLFAGIPACGLYFTACVPMLMQRGYPAPLALTTLNQLSEVFFMALLPFFVARIGLKNVLLLGIAAWFLRYACFIEGAFTFAIVGLLLHGLAYAFIYVAAYMYGDKVAPPEMKASVQSLLAFLVLGVGQVCGSVLAGQLMAAYPAELTAKDVGIEKTDENGEKVYKAIPAWNDPAM
ncbi:MAG: MFS transporter, partial [Planctomycetia bacterium]|nr:MFS transporter [Planctomycetia bacterium]